MCIVFASPEDLARAVEIGHKTGVFECDDFEIFAESNKLVFHPDSQEQQKRLVSAIKHNNKCPNRSYVVYSVN